MRRFDLWLLRAVRSHLDPHTNTVQLSFGTVLPRNFHQIYNVAQTFPGPMEG